MTLKKVFFWTALALIGVHLMQLVLVKGVLLSLQSDYSVVWARTALGQCSASGELRSHGPETVAVRGRIHTLAAM